MEIPKENTDATEVIDSNIIDKIKTLRYRNKQRLDKKINLEYLCKRYPNCNVTIFYQSINHLVYNKKNLNKPYNGENSYYLVDDSKIIPYDSVSRDDPQPKPLFDLETVKVNPKKEQVTLSKYLKEKFFSLSSEIFALKSFVLEKHFVIKKTIQGMQELPNNRKRNYNYVMRLIHGLIFSAPAFI